jgi:hypothetical protein
MNGWSLRVNGAQEPADAPAAAGREALLSLLLLAGLGYVLVFWAVEGLVIGAALGAAVTNLLPLLLLAPLLHAACGALLFGRGSGQQLALHVAAAPLFAAAWYGSILVCQAGERALAGGPFAIIGFSGPGLSWQLLQGLTVYAALIGISYGIWSRSHAIQARETAGDAPLERLLVRAGDQIKPVLVHDIALITGADDYAEVTAGNAVHLVRMSLATFEARLDGRRFVRVHRSAIVNLDHLVSAEPAGSGRLLLQLSNGADVATSRSGARKLRSLVV